MKKLLIIIHSGVFFLVLIVAGCMHTTKPEQPTNAQTAEKKIAPLVAVKPESIKAEPLGAAGGKGTDNADGEAKNLNPKYNEEQLAKERGKQFLADYDRADDKLGFLLANANSPYDEILVEVAGLLGRFDDPRSIETLKNLKQHKMHSEYLPSVAQIARQSLEWIAAAPDVNSLKPDMPAGELEALVKKYATEIDNDTGYKSIFNFLEQYYEKTPETYVPILIEYYAHTQLSVDIAKKYPELTDKGLEKCLAGTKAVNVGSCFELVGKIRKSEYSNRICEIAFYDKGNVDYSNRADSAVIRSQALTAYYYLGVQTIPYLEKILYSKYEQSKSDVIGRLESYKTQKSIAVLNKYHRFCAEALNCSQSIREELRSSLKRLGEIR